MEGAVVYPAVAHRLVCRDCGRAAAPTLEPGCGECGGLQHVAYEEPPRPYQPLIPWFPIALGQGGTSLRRLALAGGFGAKLEFLSPTGSFKDRGAAMLVSAAKAFGVREFVEDSSGNAGAALAAYGAATGMRAHIFLPSSAAPMKRAQIEAVGGIAHAVEGPREASGAAALRFADEQGLPYLSHNLSPYFVEGMKDAAWEMMWQLLGAAPDHVVLPVGNGSLLLGLQRGFEELLEVEKIERLPRLHAVQAEAIAPLVAAVNGEVTRAPGRTAADGIAVAEPPRLAEMVEVLRASEGTALSVSEEAILEWQRELGRCGLWVEPTSAAAVAGLAALREDGTIANDAEVVIPLTGTGLKQGGGGAV